VSYAPDEMMLELFRAEVESHSDSLTRSLLQLEQDSEAVSLLDDMMRAAHSIKGAARIVRVDPAVEVAHVMEDCFVAAQRGELVLKPDGIDALLRSVDLLGQISEASKNSNVDWTTFQPSIRSTVSELRNVLSGRPLAEPSSTPPTIVPHTSTPIETLPIETLPIETLPIETLPIELATPNRIHIPYFLSIQNAEPIRQQLLAILSHTTKTGEVVVDLTETHDLDAVGLAFLHSAARLATARKLTLQFENAKPALSRILKAVGIECVHESTNRENRDI
jgi:chemotaxis protein histidine kinase CheA